VLVTIGQHFNEQFSIHLEHLALNVHVILQVVVSLLSKLDLLEVDLDTDVTHVHILEAQVFLQAESALVGDVSESVKQLFGPILEQRDLRLKCLSLVS